MHAYTRNRINLPQCLYTQKISDIYLCCTGFIYIDILYFMHKHYTTYSPKYQILVCLTFLLEWGNIYTSDLFSI